MAAEVVNGFEKPMIGCALFPYRGWMVWLIALLMRFLNRRTALDRAINRFFDEARRRVRLFLTDRMMTLCFSQGRRLPLGHDLQATFPECFQHLENAELTTLLRQIDPTPDSLAGSGAADWPDLRERLHFIADMFRCYHESADLLDEPFSLAQVRTIKEGRYLRSSGGSLELLRIRAKVGLQSGTIHDHSGPVYPGRQFGDAGMGKRIGAMRNGPQIFPERQEFCQHFVARN